MSHSQLTPPHYLHQLQSKGWVCLPAQPAIEAWRQQALPVALERMAAPELQQWWRYQKTWFVGVNALPNDPLGRLTDDGPEVAESLRQLLADYLHCPLASMAFDQAQISACMPGYPQPNSQESDAAFAFRQQHFAAHLDGLRPMGEHRRRHLTEQHSFILGIPLTQHPPDAGPLMIWPGSHKLIQTWLQQQLQHTPPHQWQEIDLTDSYQALRWHILQHIKPQAIQVPSGGAYLLHRHAVHGQGVWPRTRLDPHQQGRIIAYFRPCLHSPQDWLCAD